MDLLPPTVDEMIAEVEREIRLREHVYPKQVSAGRLTQTRADRQLEVMKAIARRLHETRDVRA